jgi:hypothetical protein
MISKIFLTVVCIAIAIIFIIILTSAFIKKDENGAKLHTDWDVIVPLIIGSMGVYAMALTLYLINN